MNNQNLIKGAFLIVIALAFGLQSLNYSIGRLERSGAGMFPLIVSCLLFLLGVIIIVRSRFMAVKPMDFHMRNIALVSAALLAFALLTEFVNMTVGLIAMVFIASQAADNFTYARTIKIIVFLELIALALQKGLGFNLPLY